MGLFTMSCQYTALPDTVLVQMHVSTKHKSLICQSRGKLLAGHADAASLCNLLSWS